MSDQRKFKDVSVPTLARSTFRMGGYPYSRRLDPCGGPRTPAGQKRFIESAELLSGKKFSKALEVGCEAGFFLQRLAPLAGEVVGIELSKSAAAAARKRLKGQQHVRVVTGNFLTMALDRDFDLVCGIHVVTDFEPLIQKRLLEKMSERLRPDGILLLTVTARPFGLFEPKEFSKILHEDFRILKSSSFASPGRPAHLDYGNLALLARRRA